MGSGSSASRLASKGCGGAFSLSVSSDAIEDSLDEELLPLLLDEDDDDDDEDDDELEED